MSARRLILGVIGGGEQRSEARWIGHDKLLGRGVDMAKVKATVEKLIYGD
jgi:hypothetical protein